MNELNLASRSYSGNIFNLGSNSSSSGGGGSSLTVGSVLSSGTANGATITSDVLQLGPGDAVNPGLITTLAQTISGTKTFTSTLIANGYSIPSGTNQEILAADGSVITPGSGITITGGQITASGGGGGTTMGAVLSSGNANGATITSGVLQLAPVTASTPGILTTGSQQILGQKTFGSILLAPGYGTPSGTNSQLWAADGSKVTAGGGIYIGGGNISATPVTSGFGGCLNCTLQTTFPASSTAAQNILVPASGGSQTSYAFGGFSTNSDNSINPTGGRGLWTFNAVARYISGTIPANALLNIYASGSSGQTFLTSFSFPPSIGAGYGVNASASAIIPWPGASERPIASWSTAPSTAVVIEFDGDFGMWTMA